MKVSSNALIRGSKCSRKAHLKKKIKNFSGDLLSQMVEEPRPAKFDGGNERTDTHNAHMHNGTSTHRDEIILSICMRAPRDAKGNNGLHTSLSITSKWPDKNY
ncbi:hypothetical protein JTB14_015954 [Gonioctena quinquepunctata]|nr:hypothetical protein JTB14_015954 [Gonioctena quinquepunctata]